MRERRIGIDQVADQVEAALHSEVSVAEDCMSRLSDAHTAANTELLQLKDAEVMLDGDLREKKNAEVIDVHTNTLKKKSAELGASLLFSCRMFVHRPVHHLHYFGSGADCCALLLVFCFKLDLGLGVWGGPHSIGVAGGAPLGLLAVGRGHYTNTRLEVSDVSRNHRSGDGSLPSQACSRTLSTTNRQAGSIQAIGLATLPRT